MNKFTSEKLKSLDSDLRFAIEGNNIRNAIILAHIGGGCVIHSRGDVHTHSIMLLQYAEEHPKQATALKDAYKMLTDREHSPCNCDVCRKKRGERPLPYQPIKPDLKIDTGFDLEELNKEEGDMSDFCRVPKDRAKVIELELVNTFNRGGSFKSMLIAAARVCNNENEEKYAMYCAGQVIGRARAESESSNMEAILKAAFKFGQA